MTLARRLGFGRSQRTLSAVPAERNFPLVAVICHGVVAVTTVTLVVLTALGVGGG
jgi:hypothetical protein